MSRFDLFSLKTSPYLELSLLSKVFSNWTINWPIRLNKSYFHFYLIHMSMLIILNSHTISVSADSTSSSFMITGDDRKTMHGIEKPSYCSKDQNVQASTFLWRVKRQPAAYFFGTIHVPYTEVWDYVSTYAKEAFRSSDTVFLELVLTNPLTLRQLSTCQLLPGDELLRDHIPREMYERLRRVMERMKKSLPSILDRADMAWAHSPSFIDQMFDEITGNWHRKRPVWIMTMLDSMSIDTFRHRGEPTLDLYLAQEASMLSKSLGAIESVQEQCHPLNSLDKEYAFIALNNTLARHEASFQEADLGASPVSTNENARNGRTIVRDLIENYNCGSLNESIFARNSALSESSSDANDFNMDLYLKRELIDKRNERMAERVLRLMDSDRDKSFFFAFGAAHFIGAQSVIELVKRAGYQVEPVPIAGWYDEDTVVSRRNKHRHSSNTNSKPPRRQRERKPNSRRPINQRPQQPVDTKDSRPAWTMGAASTDAPMIDTAYSTQRQKIFQELWIRMDGFTPRPWLSLSRRREDWKDTQERLSSLIVADTPKNYVLVQYNHYHTNDAYLMRNDRLQCFIFIVLILCFPRLIQY